MSKRVIIVIVLFVIAVIVGGYVLYNSRLGSISGLKVVSEPVANVFINDTLIGKTPLEDKRNAGEYTLKLIPEESSTQFSPWEGSVTLNSGLLTYVKRDLGSSELTTAGEILSLEKISGSEAQIEVVSKPDKASVVLDGQDKGVTKILLRDVVPGEHEIAISATGFAGRSVRVQAVEGYKLTVDFHLALISEDGLVESKEATDSSESIEEEKEGTVIVIGDTPTGFLRVRLGPSTSATEAARVSPGDEFPFIEEENGWYKIEYETGEEGWISGRYAEKVE